MFTINGIKNLGKVRVMLNGDTLTQPPSPVDKPKTETLLKELKTLWDGFGNAEKVKALIEKLATENIENKKALISAIDEAIASPNCSERDKEAYKTFKGDIEKKYADAKKRYTEREAIAKDTSAMWQKYLKLQTLYTQDKPTDICTDLIWVSKEDFAQLIEKAKIYDSHNPVWVLQRSFESVLKANYTEPKVAEAPKPAQATETTETLDWKFTKVTTAYECDDKDNVIPKELAWLSKGGFDILLKKAEEYDKKQSPQVSEYYKMVNVLKRKYTWVVDSKVEPKKVDTPKKPERNIRGTTELGDQYKAVTWAKTERGFFEKGTLGDTNMRSLYMMVGRMTETDKKDLLYNLTEANSPIREPQDQRSCAAQAEKIIKSYTPDGVFGSREKEGIQSFLERYYQSNGSMKADPTIQTELRTMQAYYDNGLTALDARKALDGASKLTDITSLRTYLSDFQEGRMDKARLEKALQNTNVTLTTLSQAAGVQGNIESWKDPTAKARFFQAMNESLALGVSLEGFLRNDKTEINNRLLKVGDALMSSDVRAKLEAAWKDQYVTLCADLTKQASVETDATKRKALEKAAKELTETSFLSTWMRSGEHLWALGGSGMYGANGSIDFTKVDGMLSGMKASVGLTSINEWGKTAFVPGITMYYPIISRFAVGSTDKKSAFLSAWVGVGAQFTPQPSFHPFGSLALRLEDKVRAMQLGWSGDIGNTTLSVTAGTGNLTVMLWHSVDRAREIGDTYARLQSLAKDLSSVSSEKDELKKILEKAFPAGVDDVNLQVFSEKLKATYNRHWFSGANADTLQKRAGAIFGLLEAELENTVVNEANRTKNNRDFSGGGIWLSIAPGFKIPLAYLEWYQMNLKYSEAKVATVTKTETIPATYTTLTETIPGTPSKKDVQKDVALSSQKNDVAESLKTMQKWLADYIYELRLDEKTMTNIQTLSKNNQSTEAKRLFIGLLKTYENIPERALLLEKMNDTNTNLQQFFDAVVFLSSGWRESRELADDPNQQKIKSYYEKARGKSGSLAEQFAVQYGLSKAEVMQIVSSIWNIDKANVNNLGDIFKWGFTAVITFNQLQGNGQQGYKDIRDTSYSNTRVIGIPSVVTDASMKNKILANIETNMSQATVDRYRKNPNLNFPQSVWDADIKKLIVYWELTPDMKELGYSVTLWADRLNAFLSFEKHAECFNLWFALNPPNISRISKEDVPGVPGTTTRSVVDKQESTRTVTEEVTFGGNPMWTPDILTLGAGGITRDGGITTKPNTGRVTTDPNVSTTGTTTTGGVIGTGQGLSYGPPPTPSVQPLVYNMTGAAANAYQIGANLNTSSIWPSPWETWKIEEKKFGQPENPPAKK